jgi:translation elongation factor EF-Tu-like GTPase
VLDQSSRDDFVLTIIDVFELTGRGIVVSGHIESWVVRTGDRVSVNRQDVTVATSEVNVEFLDGPGVNRQSL